MLGLVRAYKNTKFYDCSLSRSRDMVGAHKNFNGLRGPTTPLSGMVCNAWASTCYNQPIYQIWSLYLHQPRRYDRRYKIWKMGWFEV